jgi:hypothetical protein
VDQSVSGRDFALDQFANAGNKPKSPPVIKALQFFKESYVMRELPEIECRSRFFPVRVRGSEAIRAVRWPLAFVMCVRVAIIPLALVIAWLVANRFG